MGPIGFDVGFTDGHPVAGRGLPRQSWTGHKPTATDPVAAEAADGISALERMLADEASLAIA